ncbi:MAG: bifunctional hydroxymethylpyrimidine kinase/phosphomethylpyrimidine kinase [Methanocellales archaeon]
MAGNVENGCSRSNDGNDGGKIPRALTIAGSDSGGGAGIQADLKTFAALGVFGTSALTSITAQNTTGVRMIQDLSLEIIRAQIDAVFEDIGVDALKTGMLNSREIIETVVESIENRSVPIVVDPVMMAASGARLQREDAVEVLLQKLFPIATIVTPNLHEAEIITNLRIKSIEDMEKAAKEIAKIGPRNVLIKGGHLASEMVVDVLYDGKEYTYFKAPRIKTKNLHGTGCTFSASITAYLARGCSVKEAVEFSKRFMEKAIKYSFNVGKGSGPVNPMANLYYEAAKQKAIEDVQDAVKIVEQSEALAMLIPEVGMNIVSVPEYSIHGNEVVGVEGRLTSVLGRPRSRGFAKPGASKHVASAALEIYKRNPSYRAALNLKFSEEALAICREMGLLISSYDRGKEPEEIKCKEGMSIIWGVEQALLQTSGNIPDVIYHRGDWGKEPMITLFGKNAKEVAKRAVEIAEKIREMKSWK